MFRRFLPVLGVAACGGNSPKTVEEDRRPADIPVAVRALREIPAHDSAGHYGALATYRAEGVEYLIATSAIHNRIDVFNASDGGFVRSVGRAGPGISEFRGPAAIVTLGDSIVLVSESGNARVQGFRLPDFTPIGTFGDRIFSKPRGIAARLAGNAYEIYVADQASPAFARVQQFRLTVGRSELVAIHWRTFGDTVGRARIASAGAAVFDSASVQIFVADNDAAHSRLLVFDADGRFTGKMIDAHPRGVTIEGLAMLSCTGAPGYLAVLESDGGVRLFTGTRPSAAGATATPGAVAVAARSGTLYHATGDGRIVVIRASEIASALPMQRVCAS